MVPGMCAPALPLSQAGVSRRLNLVENLCGTALFHGSLSLEFDGSSTFASNEGPGSSKEIPFGIGKRKSSEPSSG